MSIYNLSTDKLSRIMAFLRGLADERVGAKMSDAGMEQADVDEGWNLLRLATGDRLAVRANAGVVDPKVVAQLDDFENRFFPIVSGTLRRRWPELADAVFLNLEQASGPDVVITVQTLLDRVNGMPGQAGTDARELLAKRGLNAEAIAGAKALLAKLGTLGKLTGSDPEEDRKRREAAEANAWSWYLEWSEIAQGAIKNGQLLQRLGYNPGGRPRSQDPVAAVPTTDADKNDK